MTASALTPPLDVLTIGRCGVDIYPLQIGVGLEDVESFGKFLGGSPTNVAVAASRYRHRSAVITGVGDDPFGRFVRAEMRRLGVYDDYVVTKPEFNTPVTFCEIFPPDDFPLYFYREPSAPDLELTEDDVPLDAVRGARIFWVSATGLSKEPSLRAHRAALTARGRREHTIIDLDYRAMFWPDEATAHEAVRAVLPDTTVAIGNREECRVAVGQTEPVTPATTKNGLGAGDAFGGAVCHGLLSGWSLEKTIFAASTAGAIVCERIECSTAMPTEPELLNVMRAHRDRCAPNLKDL